MKTDYEGEHLEYELCQERDLGSLELLKQYESDDESNPKDDGPVFTTAMDILRSSEQQTSVTSGEFYRGTSPMKSTSMWVPKQLNIYATPHALGTLPFGRNWDATSHHLAHLLRDKECYGRIEFLNQRQLSNNVRCWTFRGGICPVHKREHAHCSWQLQVNPNTTTMWYRCWRDGKSISACQPYCDSLS